MCQICDAVDFQGYAGSPPGKNFRIATRLRELLSCSEFLRNLMVPLTFKIGRSRNQVSSRCSRPFQRAKCMLHVANCLMPAGLPMMEIRNEFSGNKRPSVFALHSVFIVLCSSHHVFYGEFMHTQTELQELTLVWPCYIDLYYIMVINEYWLYFRTLTICVIRD